MAGIRVDFEFVQDSQGDQVPALVGLWLEGYGWIVGGAEDGELTSRTQVALPAPVQKAIEERNKNYYRKTALFPIGNK